MKFNHQICRFVAGGLWVLTMASFGCGPSDPLTKVDAENAEFASPEDYAAYDLEMAELSAGQQP